MKHFIVFAGDDYSYTRSWDNFRGSFDTERDAFVFISNERVDWWQIVDTTEPVKIVSEKTRNTPQVPALPGMSPMGWRQKIQYGDSHVS